MARKKPKAKAAPYGEWDKILRLLPGYDPFKLAGDCLFDEKAADTACDFFLECIKHVKGADAGSPFILSDWQRCVVANIFGWKRKDDTRRFREVFLYVGKKNGKTAFVAGLLLYMLSCDDERGAEVYSVAASRDQAALVFQHAAGMVRQEPELRDRLNVFGDKGGSQMRSIVLVDDPATAYKCMASDANTADGANPHFVAVDELHRHKSAELSEVLQKSTAARRQPLVIYTTTADYNRPSLCNTKLKYARSVRDNPGDEAKPGFDPSFLPVIYECTKEDDPEKVETWRKANPNLGVTITEDFLRREYHKAKETPSELNNFLRLHLNIVTDADEVWITFDKWDACNGAVNADELEGRRCYGALDLSSKIDITCWALIFPPEEGQTVWRFLPRFYVPDDNVTGRERRDHVPYSTWIRQGFMETTPGDVVDYDFIKAQIAADKDRFDIQEIAYDPWNATQIAIQLQEQGLMMVEFGQGYKSMSEPAKEVEKLVISRALAHGGNPVLRWMVGNCMIERDPAGNIKPSKAKSAEKIDGVVTLVMALGRGILQEQGSVYESGGLSII